MKFTIFRFTLASCLCGLAVMQLFIAGCSSSAPAAGKAVGGGTATVVTPTIAAAAKGKSGAQLWAENCIRCHNIRSPGSFSDAQWDVALLHMRVRANLTAEEHRKILAFMKTAH